MRRNCALTSVIAAMLLASCHQLHDCLDEQVAACRNTHLAKAAWCRCRGQYVDCQEHLWDFGAGFRQGYADTLAGGRGCPPAFPPRSYWGCCYHGDGGKCAVAAWFDGYHHGTAAALMDGYGNDYSTLPGSANVYQRCCRKPVHIDLDAYKASMRVHPAAPVIEEPLVPLPTEIQEATIPGPPPEETYSPGVLDAPDAPDAPQAAPSLPQD